MQRFHVSYNYYLLLFGVVFGLFLIRTISPTTIMLKETTSNQPQHHDDVPDNPPIDDNVHVLELTLDIFAHDDVEGQPIKKNIPPDFASLSLEWFEAAFI